MRRRAEQGHAKRTRQPLFCARITALCGFAFLGRAQFVPSPRRALTTRDIRGDSYSARLSYARLQHCIVSDLENLMRHKIDDSLISLTPILCRFTAALQ